MTGWHLSAPLHGDATWTKLQRYAATGKYLLHGSRIGNLKALEPRAPIDFSVDSFSKRTAVFATEDPTWAIAYAIRSAHCPGFLNACFHLGTEDPPQSERRIFLSYGNDDENQNIFTEGVVYVVSAQSFRRMPAYEDPQLGWITECQWVSQSPVTVIDEIKVSHENLPIAPRTHRHERVQKAAREDPNGFPWVNF